MCSNISSFKYNYSVEILLKKVSFFDDDNNIMYTRIGSYNVL